MSRRLISMSRVCSPMTGIYIVLIIIPLITLFSILIANDSLARNSFTSALSSPSIYRQSEHSTSVISPDVILRNRIAEVSERIKHAEMLNQERKTEILLLRGRLNALLDGRSLSPPPPPPPAPSPVPLMSSVENNNSQSLSPSLQSSSSSSMSALAAAALLKPAASYSLIHSDFVQLPSLSSFLPHLLVPFFQVSGDCSLFPLSIALSCINSPLSLPHTHRVTVTP